MVGSAVLRHLQAKGYHKLIIVGRDEVDLCNQKAVENFYIKEKPQIVIVTAGKVGGIHANKTYPGQFIHDNLSIALNTIHTAWEQGVEQLLFLGSSCIYPRESPQPMREEVLLTGALEKTNEAYAVAKITGLKLCQYYREQYGVHFHSLMPTNLYGPGDNYHLENSHVLPALIRRFHEAKVEGKPELALWGTGKARREFLHVDDLATAIVHVLQLEDPADWYNVGTGTDITIRELAEQIKVVVGYKGEISTDPSQPEGTLRKLLCVEKLLATGWEPKITLQNGLESTYREFCRCLSSDNLREA